MGINKTCRAILATKGRDCPEGFTIFCFSGLGIPEYAMEIRAMGFLIIFAFQANLKERIGLYRIFKLFLIKSNLAREGMPCGLDCLAHGHLI